MTLLNLSHRASPAQEATVSLEELSKLPEARAVFLKPDESIDAVRPFLAQLTLIVLHFPIFRDGRAFTQARALREYEKYEGEIRVDGHILPDQAVFLKRCGVDTVVVPEGNDTAVWEAQLKRFASTYQKSVVS